MWVRVEVVVLGLFAYMKSVKNVESHRLWYDAGVAVCFYLVHGDVVVYVAWDSAVNLGFNLRVSYAGAVFGVTSS